MRTLAHISDLHFGRVDAPVAAGLLTDLRALNPNLTVISGDFTQRARSHQYQQAAEYLRQLPSPHFEVPGNHDIPLYNLFARFFTPLKGYRRHINPDLRPIYHDDELLIVGVNTSRPFTWDWDGFWKDGRISSEQITDIRLKTCEVPPTVFKIVVTHHPFIPPPGERKKGMVHGATRALDQLEECGVDMLLAGHLHRGYSGDVRTHHEAVKRSIISIQAGTAISTRRRHEPNAYNVIHIERDHVTLTVRSWTGDRFHPRLITEFERVDHVWAVQKVTPLEPSADAAAVTVVPETIEPQRTQSTQR